MMRLQAMVCLALAAIATTALVEGMKGGREVMQPLNLAAAAVAATPGASANVHGKDNRAHADAKVHEQPRHDVKEAQGPAAKPQGKDEHGKDEHGRDEHGDHGRDEHGAAEHKPDGADKKDEQRKRPTKTHRDEDDDDDDDDDDDGEDEAEKKYLERVKADKDAGKMPGRMKMVVPPRTVHTPLFELDSVVELKWEYDNNVIEVPEKLMISVQLPKDPHADPGTKSVLYDIAVNVTGDRKRFFWDTKNDVPEGVGMREGGGYIMYFYDGDIGFRMSDVVPAGYLIKYAMPFAFYISRYEHTNEGVPRNYNPNAAARPAPALALLAMLALLALAAGR